MAEVLGLIPEKERVMQIRRYYRAMEKQIKSILINLTVDNFTEKKAKETRDKIEILVRKMNLYVMRWAKPSVEDAYKEAEMKTRISLDILGAEKDKNFDQKIHSRTISDFQEVTAFDYFKANESIKVTAATYIHLIRQAVKGLIQIQEWGEGDKAVIDEIIGSTIVKKESRGFASKQILAHFQTKLGEGQFIQLNNKNYEMKAYAKMVARTRLRQAQTEAVKNMSKEYGNDLVQFSQHADPCPICEPLEGLVFSLTGENPDYPTLSAEPPVHPNCEHNISPISDAAIRWREVPRGLEAPERLKTPEGIFSDIRDNPQKYKKEYGAWYDKQGNLILKKKGTSNSVPLTDEQFSKLLDRGVGISTHTHPHNIAFSGSDLAHYSWLEATEGQVITRKGIYKVKPGIGRGGRWPDQKELKKDWDDLFKSLQDKYRDRYVQLYDQGHSVRVAGDLSNAERGEETMQAIAKQYNLNYSFKEW